MSEKAEKQYRPMTSDEKEAALLLGQCTFPVASYNKRFAADMWSLARGEAGEITERQSRTLWKLFYMYRRQVVGKKPPTVQIRFLMDIARPIYDEERAKSKKPSHDDLVKLDEWNKAINTERI